MQLETLMRLQERISLLEKRVEELENSREAKPRRKSSGSKGKGVDVWEAYSESYLALYTHKPVRNAMVNKNCCQLVDRLGKEEAVEVVKFYLEQRDAFYLKNTHHLRFCVQACETLHTKMKTGLRITSKAANVAETTSHNADITRQYLRDKHGKKRD